jgi:tRNA nucleotidyltransferase (CCA-adding enzyme)
VRNQDVTKTLTSTLAPEAMEALHDLGKIADGRGVGAFVVGGVVRDALMKRPCEDLDIVVEDDAIDFAEAAARELEGHVKKHRRFGTAILVLGRAVKVDIATSRSESYARPGALPDVAPDPIELDLKRRDFTLNAMAVRINADRFGELLDPVGGRADLKTGVLRVLHKHSFEDDPTRVLRCVRFSARFSFKLDPLTEKLLQDAVEHDLISTVSGERIMNEIRLILSEDEIWLPLKQLDSLGVLPSIHPNWHLPENAPSLFSKLPAIMKSPIGSIRSATLWHTRFLAAVSALSISDAGALLNRLRSGATLRNLIDELARFEVTARGRLESENELSRSDLYDALAPLSPETLAVVLASAGSIASGRVTLYLSELESVRPILGGSDLIRLGLEEGTHLGEVLADLRRACLDGFVTSKTEELEFVRRAIRDLDVENKR